jgi:hypothetical protein
MFILSLNGLTAIDTATAEALAAFKGQHLLLSGIAKLDAAAAKKLMGLQNLRLGLTEVDVATAEALAGWRGGTQFYWSENVSSISPDIVKAFDPDRFGLDFPSLTTLDAETAAALAAYKNWSGQLPKLTALDAETTQALAAWKGGLRLCGLTELNADTAAMLVACEGWDGMLPAITALDAETTQALAAWKGGLTLCGLTELNADTAAMLVACEGWDGMLPAVTALEAPDSVAVARTLASCKRPIFLPNLRKISPQALQSLVEKDDVLIPLLDDIEMIPEPDGRASDDFVIPEGFRERQLQQKEQLDGLREQGGCG